MSWRTVVITSRCKLDYKMGFMVVRAEETKKIFVDEIAVLLIENPAVSMTGCLLEALMQTFTESAVLHSFRVLLLESTAQSKLKNTRRYTIDEDLCEF